MLTTELIAAYKNEDLAIEAFREYRLKRGVVCKKCGGVHQYWLTSKHQFQCSTCRFRTTLRSGTILEGSKLPFAYFFIALHLLLHQGNVSTEEFQRQTAHKYYEPLWDFLRKIKSYVKENPRDRISLDFEAVVSQYFARKSANYTAQNIELYETA